MLRTPVVPGPIGWGYRCKDCGHLWDLPDPESFADDLLDAAGPYVEPSQADRDWLERMEAREVAEYELWLADHDRHLDATVGHPQPRYSRED